MATLCSSSAVALMTLRSRRRFLMACCWRLKRSYWSCPWTSSSWLLRAWSSSPWAGPKTHTHKRLHLRNKSFFHLKVCWLMSVSCGGYLGQGVDRYFLKVELNILLTHTDIPASMGAEWWTQAAVTDLWAALSPPTAEVSSFKDQRFFMLMLLFYH